MTISTARPTSDREYFIDRLTVLYESAKAHADGASLTIYEEVSTVLDLLEDEESDEDEAVSMAVELCSVLRSRYHADTEGS